MTTQLAQQDKVLNQLRGQFVFFDFALASLDRAQDDQILIGQMLRGMQTIRAVSRQASLPDIEAIAADLAEMLEGFRQGMVVPTKLHVQLMRRCLDSLEDGVDAMALDLPLPVTLEHSKYELRLAMVHEALVSAFV